jgi:fatty acid desaturase
MVPFNILLKLTKPLRGLPFDPWSVACLAEIPLFMWVGGLALWPALKLFLVIQALFGFIMTKTIFCGHRQASLWFEGDNRVEDFAEHTIISTSDNEVGWNAFVSFMFFTGFNIHIAHHLFPTVDHSKLPLVNQVLQEVLQKRGLHYNCVSKLRCMIEYSKCVVSRTPFKADQ